MFRTTITLLVVATIGCNGYGCGEIINGYPPPNSPARASSIELPDPVITAGQSLTISGAETLFTDDDPLTLTATSSDTTVVAVSLVRVDYTYSLILDALAPGTAEVSIVATEPMGDGSQDEYQPSGRSVTRTINVTVVDSAAQGT